MMDFKFLYDYYRMTGEKWHYRGRNFVNFFLSHQIRYMYWWRKANKKMTLFGRFILYRYSRKYGLEIASSAEIGEGLYLGHPYNITVGGGVKIGNNVNLHKGCTIGRENRGKRMGVPTIGNQVAIGINATVIGNIIIGNDVMIAPNSFVNFDVPSHSIVIGNPGVIHHKEKATAGYIGYCIGEDNY